MNAGHCACLVASSANVSPRPIGWALGKSIFQVSAGCGSFLIYAFIGLALFTLEGDVPDRLRIMTGFALVFLYMMTPLEVLPSIACSTRPAFVVFDESAADRAAVFKDVFWRQVLPELREMGKSVVVISHDDRMTTATSTWPTGSCTDMEGGQIVRVEQPEPVAAAA